MLRFTKSLLTGTLLSALLLSGCSGNAQEEAIPVASPDDPAIATAHSFIGKISSISGNEITLYKAKSGGGEDEADYAENGSASDAPASPDGNVSYTAGIGGSDATVSGEGDTASASGNGAENQAVSQIGSGSDTAGIGGSDATVSGVGDTASASGNGAENQAVSQIGSGSDAAGIGGSDETVVITVAEDTEFVLRSGMGGAESSSGTSAGNAALADLQAGDIIRVTLHAGTLVAASIELQEAFVTGGGNLTAVPEASASPLPLSSPGITGEPQPAPESSPDGQPAPPQGGKAGERPAAGTGGGPAVGAPQGAAPAGAGGGAAGSAAPGSAGASAGAPDKPGAAASAKPAATPAAGAKPAAGCTPAAGASAGASAKPAADAKPAAGEGGGGMNAAGGMSFGKIKSISGSKITLYTAEAPAAAPQNGADGGPQGAEPAGRPSAEPGAGGGKAGGEGGRPQGQGGGQMSFSAETTVITVSTAAKLVSVTFADGKRTETVIALSALKADDIIQYTLKSGTTEAESISLNSGNPGGK
ncbi:hypothetical protein [Paenibacillus sp. MMS20-IR301]|uniref:hypothetical protein n=1 Tax=Paenibacillus sp. MMS20-IR301 TaxID=2895946 RepID=UPI0028E9D686|nr:hypothetical protein [Paenibacillus sp. MMS20-IR301]WNS44748.1 hypothetical protein LOS79_05585 [Paenibacillus sp. MMS20-IR301]